LLPIAENTGENFTVLNLFLGIKMRNGDWFHTYTGRKFYVFDPRPEDVDIVDIAHSLSLTCRFNGHTKEFYSVAQHSIHVCNVFNRLAKAEGLEDSNEAHLCALLHDATEAYVGDLIRPIKLGIPEFKRIEESIWKCILERFDLTLEWTRTKTPVLVKKADIILLATERRDLLPEGPGQDRLTWAIEEQIEPEPDLRIVPRFPHSVEVWFTDLYNALTRVSR
jgi:5'-deoxynucleotidase YfbR-like HD superfamily hydrolase